MLFQRHHCRLLSLFQLRQLQLRRHRRHRRDLLYLQSHHHCFLETGWYLVCFQAQQFQQISHRRPILPVLHSQLKDHQRHTRRL